MKSWATFLMAGAALLAFAVPGVGSCLELDRARVAAGEWWRLATGNLAHGSASHLAWDLLAFVALGVACERLDRARTLAVLAAAPIAIGAAVLAFEPAVAIYRGLSGLDSALFVFLAATLGRRALAEGRTALALGAGAAGALFVAKSVFELSTGRALFVAGPEATVAVAHLAGAAVGSLLGYRPKISQPKTGAVAGEGELEPETRSAASASEPKLSPSWPRAGVSPPA